MSAASTSTRAARAATKSCSSGPRDGSELPEWKQDYNAGHRKVRARVEHALARLKTYKILPDYRRAARKHAVTASGIAHLHNIALAR
jgi:hypothetical protein